MTPKYVNDKGQGTKEFREVFQFSADHFEVIISELLKEHVEDSPITIKMIKRKSHDLLYAEGMSAFKSRKATKAGKDLCKELLPEFYEEMVPLEDKATEPATKKAPAKKSTAKKTATKSTNAKKTTANKKKAEDKPKSGKLTEPKVWSATQEEEEEKSKKVA